MDDEAVKGEREAPGAAPEARDEPGASPEAPQCDEAEAQVARLARRVERQNRRLVALFGACQALSATLELEEVMQLICEGVDKAFGLTSVDIYEYHAERDEVVAVWCYMPGSEREAREFVGTVYPLDEHPALRRALERGIVEYHLDDPAFERDDPELYADQAEWGEQSIIETGLVFGDEVIGLLSVGSRDRTARLSEQERELLLAFASTAAMAIRNARLYRKTQDLAIRDGLTGLHNHRYFYERLHTELARGRRYGTPVALLMIDVDDFKKFNDTYGHPAGDEALRAVAALLDDHVRRDLDVPCRYGGEEFAVILPNTPLEAATVVGRRLQKSIARKSGGLLADSFQGETGPVGAATTAPAPAERPVSAETTAPPPNPTGAVLVGERLRRDIEAAHVTVASEHGGPDEEVVVTVSIGISAFPGSHDTVDALVGAADAALYQAKSEGKNRVVVARRPAGESDPDGS